jgi:glycosyltransferase involved in cell wall biosynthesis
MPAITVLMSAYNAEKYISESIESILNQTFNDFEFIIINDGSTDNTAKIIKSYKDDRIKYISHENSGLAKSLNKGIRVANGTYIARLDADDVSYPERLEEQFKFMEDNPTYVVCGSYADVIDESGNFIYIFNDIPSVDKEIKNAMNYKNCFIHSSTFYRRDSALSIGGYYEPIRQYFEDYIFFYQILKKGKGYNFKKPLIKYRITPNSITNRHKNKKYKQLINSVVSRGYITEEEKNFLFSYTSKKRNKKAQLFNYYLKLSRLIIIHQNNYKKAFKYFIKAIKSIYKEI